MKIAIRRVASLWGAGWLNVRSNVTAAAISVAVVLSPIDSFAQQPTFELEGFVTDALQGALAGAEVVARNLSTGRTRSVTTDSAGHYFVSALSPEGVYELRVQRQGFTTQVYPGLAFHAGQQATVNITLMLSQAQAETITVEGETPMLQSATAEVSNTITQADLEALPVRERNYFRLLMLNSNVSTPIPGQNGVFASGGDVWTVGAYVDGTSNFSKWLTLQRGPQRGSGGYALETIREVKLTNQFSAEYGGHSFGVISAITKSGVNQLRGSAFVTIRPGDWDTPPPLAAEKAPYSQQQFGSTLGGPIVKNRLFYFGSYEHRRERSHTVVTSPAAPGAVVPTPADENQSLIRIDAQLSDRHSVAVRYNRVGWNQDTEVGGLNLPGSGFLFDNDVDTVHGQFTSVMSSALINELRAQFSRYYDNRVSKSKTPTINRLGYSIEGADPFSGAGFGVNPEDTLNISDTVSLSGGAHSLKFGGSLEREALTQRFLPVEYGMYIFFGPPDAAPFPALFQQSVALNPNVVLMRPRSWTVGGFAQDDWRVNRRLTMNLGARYDVELIRDMAGYNAPADKNNVDPRFGIAWDPTGDSAWVVRGGVGRFTQRQLMFTLSRGGLMGPNGIVQLTIPAGDPGFPTFPNALPSFPPGTVLPARNIERIADSLQNEFGIQVTAGVQRQLRPRTIASIDFMYAKGWKQGFLDVNHPAPIDKEAPRTVDEADLTRPIQPLPNGFRQIAELGNDGRSWYRGVRLLLDQRGDPLSFSASYTLAKADDMLNHWSVPEDSSNPLLDKGPQMADQRHNLVAATTWLIRGHGAVLSDWRVSGIGQVHSGQPYNITYGDDRWGTTQADARPGGRNTARGDGYANVDLSVARLFRLRQSTLEVRADVFNVVNNANYIAPGYVGVIGSPEFGKPTGGLFGVFPGRQLQLGAVLRF